MDVELGTRKDSGLELGWGMEGWGSAPLLGPPLFQTLPRDRSRKEDKPNSSGVLLNFRNRTIDVTEHRNAKDDVIPAKESTV
jgi:hypothetical protein